MNINIANSLFGYFETIYSISQKLIKLCGTDVIEKCEYSHKIVLDIIQDIPRLIPYKYDANTKMIKLSSNDGLLEYSKEINYLDGKYKCLLSNNFEFINRIRVIRNKYEHKMPDVKRKSSGSGSITYFDFDFEIKKRLLVLKLLNL